MEVLQKEIEDQSGMKVDLRYKAIYRRKIIVEQNGQRLSVRAIYIELDNTNFSRNFKKFLLIYSRSMSDFTNGRRMRF